MRVLRHTCITALHDAGCVREQIRAITGHTIGSINEVLDRYTKLTADQAGAALAKRLAHEGQPVESTVTTLVRRYSKVAINVSRDLYTERNMIAIKRWPACIKAMVPPVGLEPTLP